MGTIVPHSFANAYTALKVPSIKFTHEISTNSGAPNEQFLKNICSDVRSPTIFGNFLQGKEHIVLNRGMKNKVALEFSYVRCSRKICPRLFVN